MWNTTPDEGNEENMEDIIYVDRMASDGRVRLNFFHRL